VSRYVIALDVGGSSVKSGLVDESGHVADTRATPIESGGDAETILATIASIIQAHRKYEGDCIGVAFGFPGPFDYAAGISHITGVAKYEAIYGMNLRAELENRLPGLPVRFRNDAEAAIVGEARHGAGKPYRRVIGVTLGTGFGSAFLVDGVPVTSGEGVPPNGWLYPFPVRGDMADDWFSTRGLLRILREAGVNADDIASAAEAARNGDPRIQDVFAYFGNEVGTFLRPFMQNFHADALLALGGIARAFDLFGEHLQRQLPAPALTGQLGGDAALLGAANLFF
jgi:glucokinase